VFLVDIADETRLDESYNALSEIMNNKQFKEYPVLILANKIDLP